MISLDKEVRNVFSTSAFDAKFTKQDVEEMADEILLGWRVDWEIDEMYGQYLILPRCGLRRPQLRIIAALAKYGRVKTRQWVTVHNKEFMVMPRHFRALVHIFCLNRHVFREERNPDKHARNWAYVWIPLINEVAARDLAAKERLQAEAEAMKKEAFKAPFKSKKRHRKITSTRAEFLSRRYWVKASKCTDPKKRKYYLFLHYKMQQLKMTRIVEEKKGLENESKHSLPQTSPPVGHADNGTSEDRE